MHASSYNVLLSLFLLSNQGFAQLQLQWQNQYNLLLDPYSIKYRVSNHGDIFIAGQQFQDTTGGVNVYKINPSGDLEWHYQFSGDSLLFPSLNDIYIDQDGKILLSGEVYRRFVVDIDVILDQASSSFTIQVDDNGTEDWIDIFTASDSSFVKGEKILKLDDTTYSVIILSELPLVRNLMIFHYGKNGELRSRTTIETDSTFSEIFQGIYSNEEEFLIPVLVRQEVGEYSVIRSYDFGGQFRDTFIVRPPHYFDLYSDLGKDQFYAALNLGLYGLSKLDQNGNHLWDYYIPKNLPENSFADKVNTLISNTQGIFVTGKHWGVSTGGDALTMKFDSDGDERWSYRYQNEDNATYESGNDMIQINNQVVVGGEQQMDSAGTSDFLLLVLSADSGELISKTVTDWGGDDKINKIIALDDHDFYVFGSSYTNDNEIVIQKYGLTTQQYDYQSVAFNLYPNPANETIYLESGDEIKTVSFYNLDGELISKFENINSDKFTLGLAPLNSGMFFCNVQLAKGFVRRKIAVIR
ncbi:MAG: T9SS type A sorting domain-containing protein [Saprospiraceae bacterium]|nr:T9SS type A sorting domain-containing protein [Saprospiraceae bacterium]